jgi:hypothetical protein
MTQTRLERALLLRLDNIGQTDADHLPPGVCICVVSSLDTLGKMSKRELKSAIVLSRKGE